MLLSILMTPKLLYGSVNNMKKYLTKCVTHISVSGDRIVRVKRGSADSNTSSVALSFICEIQ